MDDMKKLNSVMTRITGVRGVVDGKMLYGVILSCCGYRAGVSEAAIIG